MLMLKRTCLALLLLLAAALPVEAREVIRSFTSDVTVDRNGTLEVRETIDLTVEGNEIKRGILRDFPTRYTNPDGTKVNVGFEVVGVERDGQSEPYAVEGMTNGKRIRIGDKDVFLDHGPHTYVITYRTTRQIGFFDGYDELYWNVTGNGWTFPIERAATLIRLPDGAVVGKSAFYTGSFGSSGKDAVETQKSGNVYAAETTRSLDPGEGFTVAVAFQKGVVAPPTEFDRRADWLRDNLGYLTLGLTVIGVALFYIYGWFKVGRDPKKGVIIPLFSPPENMGPAGVRYVWKQGFDDRTFAAGVVGLAVKGRLNISKDENDVFTLTPDERLQEPLSKSEQVLLQEMPRGSVVLKQENHSKVGRMRDKLSEALEKEYKGSMFVTNLKWSVIGLLITVAGLVLSGFLMPDGEGIIGLMLGGFGTIWWAVILGVGLASVRGVISGSGFWSKLSSLMAVVFIVPFALAGILIPGVAWIAEDIPSSTRWFLATALAAGLWNFIFYWLMKAPTMAGRKVLDMIEGFRLYMTTAEEERLQVLHPPEMTPQLFERYLPYAMALGCENDWNEKFATVLAAAGTAAAAGSVGAWYHGPGGFNTRGFSDSLGSSLTSAISSAATAPGSSSGSGGGGFSGGGGGGGGGSGW